MASLFLSYARNDAQQVGRLAAALEQDGHALWWDRHLAGGQAFAAAIERELDGADVVIVCWSKTAVRSDWVRDEAAVGRDKGRLVPISLDGCPPPLGFRQYHTIDLSGWNGQAKSAALVPLRAAIAGLIDGSTPSAASAGVSKPPAISPKRLRWSAAAALAATILGAGLVFYPGLSGSSGGVEAKVAVGGLTLSSADLPRELPGVLGQEMVAAFGAENAVTVIAPQNAEASAAAPFVMDGNISRVGPSVRFVINLKDQRSGVVLWSGTFEHEGADAIAARQVAVGATQVVRCGLWGASSYPRRMSDQSLSLYLKWCNEHWSGSTSATAELDAARRVTVAVPDFSFGWSALALASAPLVAAKGPDRDQLLEEGRRAARKSMELDAQNPEGFMAMASLMPLNRYADRERLLRKALSVRPTECGCERQAYGDFLASVGRLEEAAEEYERARDMRPLAPFSNLRLAQALYMVGRTDEGDRVLNAALDLWPGATSLRLLRIKSSLWTRRYDEAIAELKAADLPLTSIKRRVLAGAFEALKSADPANRKQSISALESFARDRRYNDKIVVGMLAALGAHEASLEAAAELIRTRGLLETEILFEPNMAQAATAPAYSGLVERLGLTNYWRSAASPPDICGNPQRPHFCGVR